MKFFRLHRHHRKVIHISLGIVATFIAILGVFFSTSGVSAVTTPIVVKDVNQISNAEIITEKDNTTQAKTGLESQMTTVQNKYENNRSLQIFLYERVDITNTLFSKWKEIEKNYKKYVDTVTYIDTLTTKIAQTNKEADVQKRTKLTSDKATLVESLGKNIELLKVKHLALQEIDTKLKTLDTELKNTDASLSQKVNALFPVTYTVEVTIDTLTTAQISKNKTTTELNNIATKDLLKQIKSQKKQILKERSTLKKSLSVATSYLGKLFKKIEKMASDSLTGGGTGGTGGTGGGTGGTGTNTITTILSSITLKKGKDCFFTVKNHAQSAYNKEKKLLDDFITRMKALNTQKTAAQAALTVAQSDVNQAVTSNTTIQANITTLQNSLNILEPALATKKTELDLLNQAKTILINNNNWINTCFPSFGSSMAYKCNIRSSTLNTTAQTLINKNQTLLNRYTSTMIINVFNSNELSSSQYFSLKNSIENALSSVGTLIGSTTNSITTYTTSVTNKKNSIATLTAQLQSTSATKTTQAQANLDAVNAQIASLGTEATAASIPTTVALMEARLNALQKPGNTDASSVSIITNSTFEAAKTFVTTDNILLYDLSTSPTFSEKYTYQSGAWRNTDNSQLTHLSEYFVIRTSSSGVDRTWLLPTALEFNGCLTQNANPRPW